MLDFPRVKWIFFVRAVRPPDRKVRLLFGEAKKIWMCGN